MQRTFSKNSWHYRLAAWDNYVPDTTDICSYTRLLLGNAVVQICAGLFRGALIGLVAMITIAALVIGGSFWAWLGWCAYTQKIQPMWDMVIPGAIINVNTLFIVLVFKRIHRVNFRYDIPLHTSSFDIPFVAAAWRSLRTKTCVKIYFQ